ncbi:hypothetical protein BC941DRAFT_435018 [Chlamydoabsidia padenii]|nr:hypothetical protein BC941DRAFT_435018 [Chlamydoabsidia padenii]
MYLNATILLYYRYFSRWNGFGVGVFEKQAIDHDRGVSMQAIGVLVGHSDRLDLWQHLPFLSSQMGKTTEDESDQNDTTNLLKDYFDKYHLIEHQQQQQPHQDLTPISPRYLQPFESIPSALSYYVESSTTIATTIDSQHGQDPFLSFTDMVFELGPTVFVLWKAVLMKQRILLMKSAPPMEKLCHFVYNGYLMDQWCQNRVASSLGISLLQDPRKRLKPKFNIGINDIVDLEKELDHSYIACTSDTIFDIKKDLYDVLIKLPPPSLINSVSSPTIITNSIPPLQVNAADLARYQLLTHLFPPEQEYQHQLLLQQQRQQQQSSLSFYLYEGILWWNGLKMMQKLETGFDNCLSSCRGGSSPLRQQTSQDGWKNKYHQQFENTSDGSIHALDETIGLLDESVHDPSPSGGGLDAEEIDSRAILETAAARYSNEIAHDSINHCLLGFFHVLSTQLISTLQTIVLSSSDDGDDDGGVVTITIQDMLRLGLEPWEDRSLVNQLGQMYFGKRIKVSCCILPTCCCCGQDPPPSIQL